PPNRRKPRRNAGWTTSGNERAPNGGARRQMTTDVGQVFHRPIIDVPAENENGVAEVVRLRCVCVRWPKSHDFGYIIFGTVLRKTLKRTLHGQTILHAGPDGGVDRRNFVAAGRARQPRRGLWMRRWTVVGQAARYARVRR